VSESATFDPVTGTWNDSLAGDFLWSRNNFGEGRPDVMAPFTFSVSDKVWRKISLLPGYSMAGNICGRFYANVSVNMSILRAIGKSRQAALEQMQGILGNVPEDLDIPLVPLRRSTVLLALPGMVRLGLKEQGGAKNVPSFLASNPERCRLARQHIGEMRSGAELAAFWHQEIMAWLEDGIWLMGGAAAPLEATMKFKKQLAGLVGEADANTLFSNASGEDAMLASMGPLVGVSRVAAGKMSRAEYLDRYGHRGPQEAELSMPRPAEDPDWFNRQLAEYEKEPVDVDALLALRRAEFDNAWQRLQARYPRQAPRLRREIEKVGPAARLREAVRDEATR